MHQQKQLIKTIVNEVLLNTPPLNYLIPLIFTKNNQKEKLLQQALCSLKIQKLVKKLQWILKNSH